jgi:hypothetical protein
LKKVGAVSKFIKIIQGFPVILAFFGISQNCFCIEKVMDQIYGSRYHGWLSIHGGLVTMGQHDRFGAWEAVVIARREKEKIVGVLTMTPLGGGVAVMTTQQCLTEVVGGAPMGR